MLKIERVNGWGGASAGPRGCKRTVRGSEVAGGEGGALRRRRSRGRTVSGGPRHSTADDEFKAGLFDTR